MTISCIFGTFLGFFESRSDFDSLIAVVSRLLAIVLVCVDECN